MKCLKATELTIYTPTLHLSLTTIFYLLLHSLKELWKENLNFYSKSDLGIPFFIIRDKMPRQKKKTYVFKKLVTFPNKNAKT